MTEMLGAFAVGPTCGTDYLPLDPVEAMRDGTAHRVPLIVGTNADEGRLFTRFLKLLPTTEPMIERLLGRLRRRVSANASPRRTRATRDPQRLHPVSAATSPSGTAAWQIAEAHSRHAPTYRVPLRLRAAHVPLVGARRHPRHRAVRGVRRLPHAVRLAAHRRRRPAIRAASQRRRAVALAGVQPHRSARRRLAAYTDADRAVMVFDRRSRVEYDPQRRPPPGVGGLHAGRALSPSRRLNRLRASARM